MAADPADFNHALRARLARFSYLAAMQLFDQGERNDEVQSLAERMQPRVLSELLGPRQLQVLASVVEDAKQSGRLQPLLLWGPSGSGKTALARMIAQDCNLCIARLHAAPSDALDFTRTLEYAAAQRALDGSTTLLFVESIDRCPKPRLTELLCELERGNVSLIGATRENPWVSLPASFLERLRVIELSALPDAALLALLTRALRDTGRGLGALGLHADPAALQRIASAAQGDARHALDLLELSARITAEQGSSELCCERVAEALAADRPGARPAPADHAGLERTFVAALRQSDPDAALYWMIRMLRAGEAPAFILRRMILFASEDVGNADPKALDLAVTTDHVLQRLGMPEALRSMGQCCVYLASAPKSDASYLALQRAERDAREHGTLPVPHDSRSAERRSLLPEALGGREYYLPTSHGFEADVLERLQARKR